MTVMTVVDPDSPELIPAQLARILREAIASGEIRGKLPSETELMRTYGVSGGSVRRAVERLRAEGLIPTRRSLDLLQTTSGA